MSLSDAESRFGTIFLGPTPDRETTLDRLYDAAQREAWSRQTEADYMERVRAKATDRVRALLLQARQRGDEIKTQAGQEAQAALTQAHDEADAVRAEAQSLRAEAERFLTDARAMHEEATAQRAAAHQEGLAAAEAEARAELAQTRRELAETTGVVLLTIHEQCAAIFEAWRKDLSDLLREAVEKATGWFMDNSRAQILDALLTQSMRALLDRRQFIVRVNPDDAALVTEMLAEAHQANPHSARWELATDSKLEPGSLIVESDSALINNSREARRSVVDEVLKNLSLPVGQADQDAFAAVAQTLVAELGKHGVDLQEASDSSDTADSANASEPSDVPDEPEHAAQSMMDTGASADATRADPDFAQPEPLPDAPDQAEPAALPSDRQPVIPPVDLSAESKVMPEQPMDMEPAPDADQVANREAESLVEEFLSDEPAPAPVSANRADSDMPPGLPADVADDLLAEMGFGDITSAPQATHD